MTIMTYICALSKCGARAERMASRRYRLGIAMRNSTNLIAAKSKAPPKYPASPPTRNPSTMVIAIPAKPMLSDTRAVEQAGEHVAPRGVRAQKVDARVGFRRVRPEQARLKRYQPEDFAVALLVSYEKFYRQALALHRLVLGYARIRLAVALGAQRAVFKEYFCRRVEGFVEALFGRRVRGEERGENCGGVHCGENREGGCAALGAQRLGQEILAEERRRPSIAAGRRNAPQLDGGRPN